MMMMMMMMMKKKDVNDSNIAVRKFTYSFELTINNELAAATSITKYSSTFTTVMP